MVVSAGDDRWAIPLYCDRWDCQSCADDKKRRLKQRLRSAECHRFVTLTCNPALYTTPDIAFRHMSSAVSSLVKRARRRFGKDAFEYCLVWEYTRAGWPHAHLATTGAYIPQRILSRWWDELTGARIVDIRRCKDRNHLVNYIAKELTKRPEAPAGCKHFRFSKNFLAPAEKPCPPWAGRNPVFSLTPQDVHTVRATWKAMGYHVTLYSSGMLHALAVPWLPSTILDPSL